MRAVDIILKKRDGGVLGDEEIEYFVSSVTSGAWPDYQVSALLMAILFRGMTVEETAILTRAMTRSGSQLDLSDIPGPKVDKHSTGGVGDKSSLVVAPVVAACGGIVPMMSGRGLGHTGGTLDKLESIPGFRTHLSIPELKASLSTVGCALIGQTAAFAPADKKLYALRDVTGTIESIPLISASIMSKKIAEGIEALVLDVKTGAGAFMKTKEAARSLAESLVRIGKTAGVNTQAVITAMDWPIGRAVGNANEVIESIEVLKGRGPIDLIEAALDLSERMLVSSGVAASRGDARVKARKAIDSGRALETFTAVIANQGGDPSVVDDYRLLPKAPHEHVVRSPASGFVTALDAQLIGRASVALGGGRDTAEDTIDPGVGIIIDATVGDAVERDAAILRLHYRDRARLEQALALVTPAVRTGPVAPPAKPLIVDEVL
jgi:pyrimidine-nucleoside phosphorylase